MNISIRIKANNLELKFDQLAANEALGNERAISKYINKYEKRLSKNGNNRLFSVADVSFSQLLKDISNQQFGS